MIAPAICLSLYAPISRDASWTPLGYSVHSSVHYTDCHTQIIWEHSNYSKETAVGDIIWGFKLIMSLAQLDALSYFSSRHNTNLRSPPFMLGKHRIQTTIGNPHSGWLNNGPIHRRLYGTQCLPETSLVLAKRKKSTSVQLSPMSRLNPTSHVPKLLRQRLGQNSSRCP